MEKGLEEGKEGKIMGMLIGAFLIGALALMALAEDADLDEKRRINRMADRSRKNRPDGVRRRCRYIKAGIAK